MLRALGGTVTGRDGWLQYKEASTIIGQTSRQQDASRPASLGEVAPD